MSDKETPSSEETGGDPHRQLPPYWQLLGIRPIHVVRGAAELEVLIEDRHLRTLGFMHGGVLASLVDSALGLAAWSAAVAGHTPVTVQLGVNFVRPVQLGDTVIAKATMQHLGRHTAVGRAEAHLRTGALVGTASATFLYVVHPGGHEIPVAPILDLAPQPSNTAPPPAGETSADA